MIDCDARQAEVSQAPNMQAGERVAYLEVHLPELVTPLYEEREADVQVELAKGVAPLGLSCSQQNPVSSRSVRGPHQPSLGFTYKVSIPHPDNILYAELSHEEAVHPPERELDKLDALILEVGRQRRIDPRAERLHPRHLALNTRLGEDVVVLNPIQQFRQAPKAVGLERLEYRGRQSRHVVVFGVAVDVAAEEYLKKRSDEVVDALNVATGWVPDGPDVQDALERALGGRALPQPHAWPGPRDIDRDLVPDWAVKPLLAPGKGESDRVGVLLPLAGQRWRPTRGGCGEVTEQELPCHRPKCWRDPRPGELAQLGC